MSEDKPKKKVYRLKKTKILVAETLSMLDKIATDESQSPAKRSSAVFVRADLVATLLQAESGEIRARIKHDKTEEPEKSEKPEAPTTTLDCGTFAKPKPDRQESFAEKYERVIGKKLEEHNGTL